MTMIAPEMIEAFQAKYRELAEKNNWGASWPSEEASSELLTAALALLPGEPVCHLVWRQARIAADDVQDYYEVARPGDKCVDGSDPFPVYVAPAPQRVTHLDPDLEPGEYIVTIVTKGGAAQINGPVKPAQQPVAVKALKWRSYGNQHMQGWQGQGAMGYLHYISDTGPDGEGKTGRFSILGCFGTVEEAKAAAQADYEARIRSALTVEAETGKECRHCKGKGYQPGDPEAAPIESCDYCGGSGSSLSPTIADDIQGQYNKQKEALQTIADLTARCEHDGGFDREIGPIGCNLGDKCVCIGIHQVARAALKAASPSPSVPEMEALRRENGELIRGWFVKDYADGWIFFDNEADAKQQVEATGAMMLVGRRA